MTYATAADLLEKFDAEEIAQRSDRSIPRLVSAEMLKIAAAAGSLAAFTADEQAATAAALAMINSKLLDADSVINGYLTGRYPVPLEVIPRMINSIACDLTRYSLYDDNTTETILNRYKDAMAMLKSISKGEVNLGVAPDGNKPTSNDVAQMNSTTPVFRRGDSQDFI